MLRNRVGERVWKGIERGSEIVGRDWKWNGRERVRKGIERGREIVGRDRKWNGRYKE